MSNRRVVVNYVIHRCEVRDGELFALITFEESPGRQFWMKNEQLNDRYQRYLEWVKTNPLENMGDMPVEQQALMMILIELSDMSKLAQAKKN